MGEGRPGFAGPRAARAAPGFRARSAGDESHDMHFILRMATVVAQRAGC